MLSAALFVALLASTQPEPKGPISPANLPPPPMPAPKSNPAQISVYWESNWFDAPLSECRRRALAAVAEQTGFRYAEISPDGHIVGYTDKCRLMVLLDPGVSGINYYIFAATRFSEMESTARDIGLRFRSSEWTPIDGRSAGNPDAELDWTLLPIFYHIVSLPNSHLMEHYFPVMNLMFTKRGYEKVQVFGNEGILLGRKEKTPNGFRLYKSRQLNPPIIASKEVRIQEPQRLQMDVTGQLILLRLGSGPKNETIKAYIIGTTNSLEPQNVLEELKGICAATGKVLFE
jgi:hypothetical protein